MLAGLLLLVAAPASAETTLRAIRQNAPPLVLRAAFAEGRWTIRVLEAGSEVQRIAVTSDLPRTAPRIADADGDRAGDIWVPVIDGGANTAWDLWRLEANGRFRRAGEVSGIGFSRDAAGRLVTMGRNGCCGFSFVFHRFDADGALEEAFAVDRHEDDLRRGVCEGVAMAVPAPAAMVRTVCGLASGAMPGRRIELR
jgi:hypothetical protein